MIKNMDADLEMCPFNLNDAAESMTNDKGTLNNIWANNIQRSVIAVPPDIKNTKGIINGVIDIDA